jgi:hypothetical protein
MAVGIMHCLAVKFCAMLRRMLASCGKIAMVTLAIVEPMIDVAVWSAVIRGRFVVPIRTYGRFADAD